MFNKKIFIAGGPRCGTTLMQGLLCKDNETMPMTKESTYFNFLIESYQKGKYMWDNHTHCYFRDQLEFLKFSKFLTDNYFKQIHSLYPANVLIHKHPGMTKTFPDIMELYPDSLFIVMLRDPRDSIASYLKIKRDSGYDVNYFINMFINELEPFMKFFKNNDNFSNVLFVRYEDLLLNADEQMEKLRNFTGLELNFDPTKEGWKSNRENGEYASELDGKPINGNNIGKSMFELSNKEIEYILSFKSQIDEMMPVNIWWDESIYLPYYKSSFRLTETIKSMYNDGGKQKEIIRLSLDGVERFGGNEFYYKILGMMYEEMDDLNLAEEYLNKSLEIKQDPLVMNSLGLVYEKSGDLDKSLEIFYKCVELDGSVADFYNNVGRILIKMDRVEEGKEYSKKAMEMDKEFPEAEYVYEDGILNEVTKKE